MTDTEGPAATPATPPTADDQEAARMVRADLVAAAFFILLGVLILYGSWTMPRLEVRRIHPLTVPGLVPGMLSAALVVCGLILGIRSLRARTAGGWRVFAAALVSEGARRTLAVIILVLVYTLGLVGWLPFWAATSIFVFAFVLVFEVWLSPNPKPLLNSLAWGAGLAMATAIAVTLVFERLFLVRLP